MAANASFVTMTRKVRRLVIGLLVLCGGSGAVAALLLLGAIRQQEAATALIRSHMTADMMHDAVRGDVLSILAARDPALGIDGNKARSDLRERLAEFRGAIEESRAFPHSQAVTTAIDAVKAPLADYERAATTIADLSTRDPAAAVRALPQFFARFEELEGGMEKVTEAIESHGAAQSARAQWLGTASILLIVAAMVAALVVAALVARAVQARLIAPLVGLSEAIERLAAGDRSRQVEGGERPDELGTLARGIESFRQQLQAAEDAKAAQSTLIVDSIGSGLSALAEGDLTRPVSTELEPPFASLKSDFNAALSSLSGIVGEVRDSAAVLRLGAREIAEANGELARRTERNASSLEQTSSALSEIDRHVHDTATAATETVDVANSGQSSVVSGRETTDMAVAAMTRVSESAQGIDAVIEGLDKIAFQTRVLAMNAAVEAGRAGEAGRGFAVVADLVSALAMRAEEEAKLARAKLTATQADIGEAVAAVRSVDQALDEIAGNVGRVHGRISGIASANERQAGLIGQIREAIEEMNRATQQSAAMVEESAAAAAQLNRQAELLEQSSGRFRLPPTPDERLRLAA